MKESSKRRQIEIVGIVFLMMILGLVVTRVLSEGIFSNKLGINLAVVGNRGSALLVLRPDEDILGWVNLPEKLKIKIYNSQAQYPIGSLWDYGVSEKHPYEIFEKSLGLSMGVAVSRTIKVPGEVSVEEVLASLHKINLRTNLSVRDRFLIRKYLDDAVSSKKVLEMDIPNNAMEKITEPDGKEFLVFNSIISLWTKNKFLLESILNENCDATINNLSGLSGLGTLVSRQMEAAGIRVVEVKTDPTQDLSGNGCIFVSWGSYPNTEKFLLQQLNCEQRQPNIESDNRGVELWLK
ncbi:TPA: hypothetical protein DIU27_01940 [Candidatus Collierbacteria bacterium]|uniref:LytR/CpsA/Psr regulator C-terminal domain-containing protein n=1 Tax=Candidatus Collierbacteria bacterium GW2011_GWB2_44_22 TaxID=1618387 RepID=A0A0G1HY23_9BACT|nr:MAG: hypothetical protein UW31_C0010G0015 [Candidatus Collierbacteria bacterium GW2011_GWA2_44_13]KKT50347.1 MAG: hypothetical protein UW42_C0020G0006 [Candidatus Collierbacteria bacterium GW2011_GWB1_44_197]KKT52041.1 MAG: hypothetical protein UW44_C0005G0083 [Candidatus Collierbacteria bacterium GW2011_GWB2_44_22]KKT62627.1 MAG: hypothetical protein UW56_C0005G0063 [Candidatus Collierbacteria bacterium GW2011_GWD1_44_27]KKT66670.1 MAG: hypothetical protein UW58_C0004G0019 [Candidatus Colli